MHVTVCAKSFHCFAALKLKQPSEAVRMCFGRLKCLPDLMCVTLWLLPASASSGGRYGDALLHDSKRCTVQTFLNIVIRSKGSSPVTSYDAAPKEADLQHDMHRVLQCVVHQCTVCFPYVSPNGHAIGYFWRYKNLHNSLTGMSI